MDYRNTEMKLDALVNYFNDEKINLSPIFQRGHVWPLQMRKELMKNIVLRRPIPAIFLYKDEAGSTYSYNILDGKQRLESILMFIGDARQDFKIKTWAKYIYGDLHREDVGYAIDIGDGNDTKIEHLEDKAIRDLREYPIPTVEIELNENATLDEMIRLFVDINQYGMRVTRLNIVRALKQKDPLLKEIYGLVAIRQKRAQDEFARRKSTPYVYVLKKIQMISRIMDANAQADRMWEKLFELALFVRSGRHEKPTEILKTFIRTSDVRERKLSSSEKSTLKTVFVFLREAYRTSDLVNTPLATDQTHFYTMVTSLLGSPLVGEFEGELLIEALVKAGNLIAGEKPPKENQRLVKLFKSYRDTASKQTTDVSRRQTRQDVFTEIIRILCAEKMSGSKNGRR